MVEGTAHAQRLGLRLSVGHQAATRVKPTSRHHDLVPSTEPEASTGFGGAGESPTSAALLGLLFFFSVLSLEPTASNMLHTLSHFFLFLFTRTLDLGIMFRFNPANVY